MTNHPFESPNYDLIHQLALSVIGSSDYYDKAADRYAKGQCSSDALGDALEQYQNDGADLTAACKKIQQRTLLVATNDNEIYALTIDHYFVTVKVAKALNISGGLDQMAVKQLLDA